jgi:hypothetical protein
MTTPTRIAASAFNTVFNGNNAPAVPGSPQAGDLLVWATGENIGSNATPAAPTGSPNTWTDRAPHSASHQIAVYTAPAWGGGQDTIPGVAWGSNSFSWGITVLLRGVDLVSVIDVSGDRFTNNTEDLVGPASALTPTRDNGYVLFVGAKNRTSASSGSVLTAPSNFTMVAQLSTGSISQTIGLCEWVQGAKTSIPGNTFMTGSLADATTQSMQGVILVFLGGPTAPSAGRVDVTGQTPSVVGAANSILEPLTARVRKLFLQPWTPAYR